MCSQYWLQNQWMIVVWCLKSGTNTSKLKQGLGINYPRIMIPVNPNHGNHANHEGFHSHRFLITKVLIHEGFYSRRFYHEGFYSFQRNTNSARLLHEPPLYPERTNFRVYEPRIPQKFSPRKFSLLGDFLLGNFRLGSFPFSVPVPSLSGKPCNIKHSTV